MTPRREEERVADSEPQFYWEGEYWICESRQSKGLLASQTLPRSPSLYKRVYLLTIHFMSGQHLSNALTKIDESKTKYIQIEKNWGRAPVVSFEVQSGPVSEVWVDGIQARDMLQFIYFLYESLDTSFPCEENKKTMESIQAAIAWQDQRTADRISRGVEGKDLP